MKIWLILVLLIVHWIADFVFQNDEMARGKSKSLTTLLEHCTLYTLIWVIPIIVLGCFLPTTGLLLFFLPITFLAHLATDYYTSKVNALLWEAKEVHGFFVSIGFDQLLHYAQIIITFKLLSSI